MEIELRHVGDFTIIRLDDGRMGIAMSRGLGILADYNVVLGRDQHIKLDGKTKVTIVRYPLDILMETLEKEKGVA